MSMSKGCRNPDCDSGLKVVGNWCTSSKCKALRAQVGSEKKRKLEGLATALVGSKATLEACTEIYDVLGQRDYDPTKLTKKEISEDALPEEKKLIEYLIWGRFGEEDLLTFVSLKALLKDNPDNMDMLFQYEKGRGKVFISTKKQLLAELANEEEGKEEEEEEEEVS